MPNFTPNYNLAKPIVNSAVDQDLWGGELNNDMDIIDSTMANLQTQIDGIGGSLPIGSIYMNYSDGTNPATLLGYGTWTAITDKFVVARGSTYVTTGGAAQAAIGVGNLPSNMTLGIPAGAVDNTATARIAGGDSVNNQRTISVSVTTGGSSTPLDIIPPYQAVYMWYRSA